jgi:alpha-glucosidase
MMLGVAALLLLAARASAKSVGVVSNNLDEACAGYNVSHVQQHGSRVKARLDLVGAGCGVYGPDVAHLKLLVEYETGKSYAIKCEDQD